MWDYISSVIARFLAKNPWAFIIGSIVSCALFSAGLVHVRLEQDIRASFSPANSETENETRIYMEFFNLTVYPERAFFIFSSKNNHSNILSEENIIEMMKIDKKMMDAVSFRESDGRRNCEPLCDLNRPFHLFLQNLLADQNMSQSQQRTFGFPETKINGTPIFLGLHMSTVSVDNSNKKYPVRAKTVVLWYFSRSENLEAKKTFSKAVNEMFELSKNQSFNNLELAVFSDQIANKEMIRGAIEATTLMTIGFFFLVTLVIIVIVRQTSLQMAPYLVATTLLTPIAATISAFGFICWFGLPTFSIQCVTPFLVLGIGVDDAFILIHRWKHYSNVYDRTIRLEKVIIDVGPSITITSLTNIIAFGIGFFTPTPQMSLFCLAASLALFLDYILTYTILAPVIFLCHKQPHQAVEPKKILPVSWLTEYSLFLCSLKGRILCIMVTVVMYSIATTGVFAMRSTFEPAKAFPSNSRLVNALNAIKPVFNVYFPINVFVNQPPNITNPEERSRFYQMVSELERIRGIHANQTLLFLPHFERFDESVSSLLSVFGGVHKPSFDNLAFWLHQLGNPAVANFREKNGKSELVSFRFTLLGHGMSEWAERAQAMKSIRTTLNANKNHFNATIFDVDSAILNLILSVGQDLIGSIAVTVVCMALVCLVFVANGKAVFIITCTISSICFTLVGCLSWWGADLDPVTQVDVLLATGFSVDYTAHVAYQFFRATGLPKDKVLTSLSEMAEPMLEAGLSTFLCMLPLIFVPTYAIVAFAKTVFLVVGIGLLHGLFILPVILAFFTDNIQQEDIMTEKPASSDAVTRLLDIVQKD